ncbi:mitogen-activated protein kinase kinase kinase YODA-like [Andrographis paniculata]|uniref:mitogen-activated protein kinase kinase kinase YODA-like n=1 Tax=Andrographis paniculata TaxID=175694 RepID=UPI0021E7DA12|nr:mitogen-activated protein kinase kinase kinase YODA-like [Andrographis paniculata]
MSRNYDNWERLVAAVLKREQLWQLFHSKSLSPSLSSESSGYSFSFGLNSSIEDAPYSSPEWSTANRKRNDDEIARNVVVDDDDNRQSLVENVLPDKNVSSKPFWKRALKIEVPKVTVHLHGAIKDCSDCPKSSPRLKSPTATPKNWPGDGLHELHPLPLPPLNSKSSPASRRNSAETSPSVPSTPEKAESSIKRSTRWKKGKLIGTCSFGDMYLGFNSEKGAMCAMKEVNLSFAKTKQRAEPIEKEIALLSSFNHPNLVRYYGSETLGDNLYIYSEYMSGGSIHKILELYGNLGESAIRSYTRQILAGLAYLHSKTIAHRDIKGANILVDPNGIVKLTNLGIETHILQITRRQPRISLLTDSPYWMAPEAIMNSDVCNLHMDIWSLGCTVIEMATSRPPMSKYDGGLAMFKVAKNKELPTIPSHLSDDAKDFLQRCLQWDPLNRATASQLLEHPFVKRSLPLVKPARHRTADNAKTTKIFGSAADIRHRDLTRHGGAFEASKPYHQSPPKSSSSAELHRTLGRENISAPVSPVGSPLPRPSSPRHLNFPLLLEIVSGMHARTTSPPSNSPATGIRLGFLHRINESILPPETFRKNPAGGGGSPSYWDPKILRSRDARTPLPVPSEKFRRGRNPPFDFEPMPSGGVDILPRPETQPF